MISDPRFRDASASQTRGNYARTLLRQHGLVPLDLQSGRAWEDSRWGGGASNAQSSGVPGDSQDHVPIINTETDNIVAASSRNGERYLLFTYIYIYIYKKEIYIYI